MLKKLLNLENPKKAATFSAHPHTSKFKIVIGNSLGMPIKKMARFSGSHVIIQGERRKLQIPTLSPKPTENAS